MKPVSIVLFLLPLLAFSANPGWWSDRGVTNSNPSNDYAAVNQGQVKNIAVAATAELNASLAQFDGAGSELDALAARLLMTSSNTNDYAAVNLGQLKNLAKPFYDRLLGIGYRGQPLTSGTYPWIVSGNQANDYAMGNIGQVKNLFCFDVALDSDGNGLPDWWELHWFNGLLGTHATDAAQRGDGLSILDAFQQGLNPNDFYNGQTPVLAIVSGNSQTGNPGGFVPAPLIVSVTDSSNVPIYNAPVTFTVTSGGGTVQKSSSATAVSTLTVNADGSGQAKAFFKLPAGAAAGAISQITATTGTGGGQVHATFSETSDDGSGSHGSPFAPSDMNVSYNSDGSIDMSWTNNADDGHVIPIRLHMPDGSWKQVGSVVVPANSFHIPPQ